MRVTNKMLSNNFLSDMNTNLQNLQTIQKQMSTGKLFSKPSDDPFSVARAMQLHTNINTNTMYNANIKDTINWLDTTDTALKQTGDVFQRVRELLVGSGNGTYSPSERQKVKDEINQRVSQLSQILNTNFDGKYIFGGTRGTAKPTDVLNPFTSKISDVTHLGVGSTASVSGDFIGTETTNYTFNTDFTPSPPTLTLARKVNTDGTWGTATDDPPYTLIKDAGSGDRYYTTVDGMKIYLNGNTNGNGYTFTVNVANHIGNTKLVYANKDGSSLNPTGTQDEKNQFAMIGTDLQTEVSQGVTMKYNVGANEVLQYGTEAGDNVMQLLQRITNHLDGKNSDGTDHTVTDATHPDPTSQLTGQDLKDLDSAISNLLTVRSQVGAKQNRMESAQTQNTDMNASLTEIMAKTEDIDITQKTMEYATAQTVYLASLQTSAKVILPTLMDYLR